ncbi:hypothetical protein [Sphingomonas sp. S-NIH.Pt15_0812]|uniref:hypothetical protein n=1 Tax=Sphingomonas sp. S-NIH.Pt15_0812 TaxID=1920129 RepID=UPI000F7D8F50|nr:hypothetical protein [Sphingomonas sp. S-NIH.Pt15_0812]RSU53983.1 hypothetical protein BRX43_03115 [Sphingomonas sp. S-NIH.Pt15_0812]
MNAIDTHALLLTCPAPLRALKEFGEEVARGTLEGTATVIYTRPTGNHEGLNTKLQRFWRRIEAAAQQAALWTEAEVQLPISGQNEAVRLTAIKFDEEAVAAFVAARQPDKPARGRKRKQDEWTPFWMAAIKLAKAEQLNVGTFETVTDLRDRLHTMMNATLDDQTIKPFVTQIYDEVVKVPASKIQKDCALK